MMRISWWSAAAGAGPVGVVVGLAGWAGWSHVESRIADSNGAGRFETSASVVRVGFDAALACTREQARGTGAGIDGSCAPRFEKALGLLNEAATDAHAAPLQPELERIDAVAAEYAVLLRRLDALSNDVARSRRALERSIGSDSDEHLSGSLLGASETTEPRVGTILRELAAELEQSRLGLRLYLERANVDSERAVLDRLHQVDAPAQSSRMLSPSTKLGRALSEVESQTSARRTTLEQYAKATQALRAQTEQFLWGVVPLLESSLLGLEGTASDRRRAAGASVTESVGEAIGLVIGMALFAVAAAFSLGRRYGLRSNEGAGLRENLDRLESGETAGAGPRGREREPRRAEAGEHGKGFAVVASEVRSLAERSRIVAIELGAVARRSCAATEEVRALLDNAVPTISSAIPFVLRGLDGHTCGTADGLLGSAEALVESARSSLTHARIVRDQAVLVEPHCGNAPPAEPRHSNGDCRFSQPPRVETASIEARGRMNITDWDAAGLALERRSTVQADGEKPAPRRIEGDGAILDTVNDRDELSEQDATCRGSAPQVGAARLDTPIERMDRTGVIERRALEPEPVGRTAPEYGAPSRPSPSRGGFRLDMRLDSEDDDFERF